MCCVYYHRCYHTLPTYPQHAHSILAGLNFIYIPSWLPSTLHKNIFFWVTTPYAPIFHTTYSVERRGGVVSESDAWPKGRAFESRPIRNVRLCSWAKHSTTNCPCLLGYDTKNRRPPSTWRLYTNVTCSGLVTHSSISWWHWLWVSCAHHRLQSFQ